MINNLPFLLLIVTILIHCRTFSFHRLSSNVNTNQAEVLQLFDSEKDESNFDTRSPFRLDRNMAIACTNRYNCERTCVRAKMAKQASKASLIDALTRSIGESTLTDAHKLGIQFGRHKSCEKCSLIYSNCIDDWYRIARRELFNIRQDDARPLFLENEPNRISSQKSSNNL